MTLLKQGERVASVPDNPHACVGKMVSDGLLTNAVICKSKIRIPGNNPIEILEFSNISTTDYRRFSDFYTTEEAIPWLLQDGEPIENHQVGSISIKARPIVPASGIKSWEILSIKRVLHDSKLPSRYIEEGDYFFYIPDAECIVFRSAGGTSSMEGNLQVGDVISDKRFQRKLALMRSCGKRLHEINRRIRAERREWEGQGVQTFRI